MPQIIIESSANLSENIAVSRALSNLVQALATSEAISPRSVKTYHQKHGYYPSRDGNRASFVHCEVEVDSSPKARSVDRVTLAMYQVLRDTFDSVNLSDGISLTLEVRESKPLANGR